MADRAGRGGFYSGRRKSGGGLCDSFGGAFRVGTAVTSRKLTPMRLFGTRSQHSKLIILSLLTFANIIYCYLHCIILSILLTHSFAFLLQQRIE